MTSIKFKVGDLVKATPGAHIYVVDDVRVLYTLKHAEAKFVGIAGVTEAELVALNTEEQAEFKKKKTEELRKNMLAAIAEYEAFLKN